MLKHLKNILFINKKSIFISKIYNFEQNLRLLAYLIIKRAVCMCVFVQKLDR